MIKKIKLPFRLHNTGLAVIELIVLVTVLAGIAAATKLSGDIQNLQKQAATNTNEYCYGLPPTGCKDSVGDTITACIGLSPLKCKIAKDCGCALATPKPTKIINSPTPFFSPIPKPSGISKDTCGAGMTCKNFTGTPCLNAEGDLISCKNSSGDSGTCCVPDSYSNTQPQPTSPVGGGGGGGGGGTGGGGYSGQTCSSDSNAACDGLKVGDSCSGSVCTADGSTGSDGNLICKCPTGGGGGGGGGTGGPSGGLMCTTAGVDKTVVKEGETVTFTATSNSNATSFFFQVINRASGKVVCVTSGGDLNIQSPECPAGTHPLVFKDPNTAPRTVGTRTVTASEVFLFDKNVYPPYGGHLIHAKIAAYIAQDSGNWTPLNSSCQADFEYYRPGVCLSSTITGNQLTSSKPLEVTIEGNPPAGTTINKFYLAFYNGDNLYGPGNPKPLFVNGSHYIRSDCTLMGPNACKFTIEQTELNRPDENWNNQIPANIQVNGYFGLSDTGFSKPEPACVKKFTIDRTGAPPQTTPPDATPPETTPPETTPPEDLTTTPPEPTDKESSEETLCREQGGNWKKFPNSCVDSCQSVRNPDLQCLQVISEGCECGPDKCWTGSICEENIGGGQDWWAPDGTLCTSSINHTLYSDTSCIKKIGYQTENISSGINVGDCPAFEDLIKRSGWTLTGEIEDGGMKFELERNDFLPLGFEAIGESKTIKAKDTDREMPAGVWSVYEVCEEGLLQNILTCDPKGEGECFKAGGLTVDKSIARSFQRSDDEVCAAITEDDPVIGNIYDTLYNCLYTMPPKGKISGTLTVDFKDKSQFDLVRVYLQDTKVANYLTFKDFEKNSVKKNEKMTFTFEFLFPDREYEIYVKAIKDDVHQKNIEIKSSCSDQVSCRLTPDATVNFKIIFPEKLPAELTSQGLNQAYMKMINQWINGQVDAIKMSEFLKAVTDAPGLKTATCDPKTPGGCQFNP